MYQFGLGVSQDLNMAKQHYHRCREMDPNGMHVPVTIVLLVLVLHRHYASLPPWKTAMARVAADLRVHAFFMQGTLVVVLLVCRVVVARGLRAPRPDGSNQRRPLRTPP